MVEWEQEVCGQERQPRCSWRERDDETGVRSASECRLRNATSNADPEAPVVMEAVGETLPLHPSSIRGQSRRMEEEGSDAACNGLQGVNTRNTDDLR